MSEVSTSRYFDHNATSPLSGRARQAWQLSLDEAWSNPSSPHAGGVRCRALLEEVRERIAGLIGGLSQRLVFTSGATESNNAVFAHFLKKLGAEGKVAISSVEHPSVWEAAKGCFESNVMELPVDSSGIISIQSLVEVLNDFRPGLVSVMAANNETGVIQPWLEIRNLCREAKVPFHCDATQWLGRLPSHELGACDFLSGSFHKLGGPKGVGFLLAPEGETMRLMTGGEQEGGMRAGTENLPAIFSASAALDESSSEIPDGSNRDRFESRLRQLVPETEILGQETPRLPMVSSLILPIFENIRWVNRMDRLGFAISTGSACATGHEGPSHVLAAMRRSPDEARRVVRVSGGWSNGPADWVALADAFGTIFDELRAEDGDSQTIAL